MKLNNVEQIIRDKRKRAIRNCNFILAFLVYTYTTSIWMDGDGIAFKLRLWNPISWLFLITFIPFVLFFEGFNTLRKNLDELGLTLSDYWKQHKNERSFI